MSKEVSNEEYVKMFGTPNMPSSSMTKEQRDNHLTMRKVANRYKNILDKDEIYWCMLEAMRRCIKHHEAGRGNKFTTSLWTFIRWECQREVAKKLKQLEHQPMSINEHKHFDIMAPEENMNISHIQECITLLPEPSKELIQEYYFDKYTMEEIGARHNYTKEAARQKVKKAVNQLREIYIAQS